MNNSYPLKKSFKFCFASIATKPVRFAITVLLAVCCLGAMGMGLSAASVDADRSVYGIFEDTGEKNVYIKGITENGRGVAYTDYKEKIEAFFDSNNAYQFAKIYQKESISSRLLELASDEGNAYFSRINEVSGMLALDAAGLSRHGFTLLAGSQLPQNQNEVAISKYQYEGFVHSGYKGREIAAPADLLGKTLDLSTNQDSFRPTIVGIVDTKLDPRTECLKVDLRTVSDEDEFDRLIAEQNVLRNDIAARLLFVSEDFASECIEKNKVFAEYQVNGVAGAGASGADYVSAEVLGETFLNKKDLNITFFDEASKSLGAAECVIAKSIVQKNLQAAIGSGSGILDDEFIAEYYGSYPYMQLMLGETKTGQFNFSKASRYRVVGYYDDYTLSGTAPNQMVPNGMKQAIVVSNGVYQPIAETGYYVKGSMTTLSGNKKADIALISNIYENKTTVISGKMATDADSIYHKSIIYAKLGLIFGAILAVFTVLMMLNFISATIAAKQKEIGILRSLGVSKSSVYRIFLLESLVVLVISFLLSLPLTYGLTVFTNVKMGFLLANFTFFTLSFLPSMIVLGVALIIAFVGSLMPILKMTRKKPMDIIRS